MFFCSQFEEEYFIFETYSGMILYAVGKLILVSDLFTLFKQPIDVERLLLLASVVTVTDNFCSCPSSLWYTQAVKSVNVLLPK